MKTQERFTEGVKHPNVLELQYLLERWERAYDDKCRYPTPDHIKAFGEIDEIVKSLTILVRALSKGRV